MTRLAPRSQRGDRETLSGEARRSPPTARGAVRARAGRFGRERRRGPSWLATVQRPPALPPISPSGPAAPRSRSSPRVLRRACRSTRWRDRAASSFICRRRMSRRSSSTRGRSPISAGNANIVRLPQAISARMRAIVDLFLERLEAARRQVAIVRSLPLAGRSWREDLRPERRACRLGRRRQGRAVRPPALA